MSDRAGFFVERRRRGILRFAQDDGTFFSDCRGARRVVRAPERHVERERRVLVAQRAAEVRRAVAARAACV